jgi:hypothetical protein
MRGGKKKKKKKKQVYVFFTHLLIISLIYSREITLGVVPDPHRGIGYTSGSSVKTFQLVTLFSCFMEKRVKYTTEL